MAKVRKILERLKEYGLYLNPEKYEFVIKLVKYLGFIVTYGIGI
jgi:hypothetical protein